MSKIEPRLSDIPCATLMLGGIEFISQEDGRLLLISNPAMRYQMLEVAQAEQLSVWLNNHLERFSKTCA